jgi:hypothetical protein
VVTDRLWRVSTCLALITSEAFLLYTGWLPWVPISRQGLQKDNGQTVKALLGLFVSVFPEA